MQLLNAYLKKFMAPFRHQTLSLLSGGLTAALCFFVLQYGESNRFSLEPSQLPAFFLLLFFGMACALLLEAWNRRLNKIISWQNSFASRFMAGLGSNLLLSASLSYSLWWICRQCWESLFPAPAATGDSTEKAVILLSMVIFVYQIAYAIRYSYHQYAVEQLASLQRERSATEWRYKTLRAQLSPHYLFNNLNTIGALVQSDQERAEAFIRQLVSSYQYILQQRDHTRVSLEEEVAFVEAYFYLLQIRFGEQIKLHIHVPERLKKTTLPPLCLQLLVENAVKHNSPQPGQQLDIHIRESAGMALEVSNNRLQGNPADSFQLGWQHLQQQYSHTGPRQPQRYDGDPFRVVLPLFAGKEGER